MGDRCKSCGCVRPLGAYLGEGLCEPCFRDIAEGRQPLCRSPWGKHVCTKPAMHPIMALHSDGTVQW